MSAVKVVCLRIVGGNDALIPISPTKNTMRPRLRVVKPDEFRAGSPLPVPDQPFRAKRPGWATMWVVGLVMAMVQGMGQAIAERLW
jgi:hypothetical protein